MTTVDVDLDTDVWIGLPNEWTEETWPDHRDWAREIADLVWTGAEPGPGEPGPDHLALGLAMLAESPLVAHPARSAYLWLPGPTIDVLPVFLEVYVAEDDRDATLRALTRADEPALREPQVEPFVSEHLGEGIRVLRHVADPQTDDVATTLSHAWRAGGLDVLLWMTTFDAPLAARATDDVDDLARGLHLVDG